MMSDTELLPPEVLEELAATIRRDHGRKAPSASDDVVRLAKKLGAAAAAYDKDRYLDASRLARSVLAEAPESVAARELCGLSAYRLGRFAEALRYLMPLWVERGDPAQLPVMMDCERALGHYERVEALFSDLRRSSPPAELLVEGRLVYAGSLAERGMAREALKLLLDAGAGRRLRHPAERHVRQWYVLADLYDRLGEPTRAREVFGWVAAVDSEMADVVERLAELGRRAGRRGGRRAASRGGGPRHALFGPSPGRTGGRRATSRTESTGAQREHHHRKTQRGSQGGRAGSED